MNDLEQKKVFQGAKLVLLYIILATSFIGLLDAGYLTYAAYSGESIKCTLLSADCDTVTTSIYSRFLGQPISLFGAGFYLFVFILSLVALDKERKSLISVVFFFSIFAFITSLILVYLQAFVLRAWCLYCLGSAATSAVIFFSSFFLSRKFKNPTDV